MKASMVYRIAAVLLLLFAAGHTLAFSQTDPQWGIDPYLHLLRSIQFNVQGFDRTFWDFFLAAGYSVGALYLFAAVLAWQLSRLPAATLALMRLTTWSFALCFAVIAVLSWTYLFVIPIAFSTLIAICLVVAAWLAGKESASAVNQMSSDSRP
jgi:hypothetical protein